MSSKVPITNIVLLSYGWSHDIDTGEFDYYDDLAAYDSYITNRFRNEKSLNDQTAVICVSWHSDTSAFGKAVGDLLPGTRLPALISAPVAMVFFPLSVWSKTALADKIGYGDLSRSLGYIYEHCYAHSSNKPNIYMIGHSFGCRILSGAIREKLPPRLPLSPFKVKDAVANSANKRRLLQERELQYTNYIKGALFVLPALTEANLPNEPHFPLLVIQSRHDHLNSVLFPIASILFSGYISSEYLPKADNWMYREEKPPGAWDFYFVQPYIDLKNFIKVTLLSAPSWPASYIAGQYKELSSPDNWTLKVNYLTDTLGQLPVIDIPIQELVGNNSYHKGLFNLGEWNESAARIGSQSPVPLNSITSTNDGSLYLHITNGVQYLNAQDVANQSVYWDKIEYDTKFLSRDIFYHVPCGFVSWLDPIGSHDDYFPHDGSKDVQIFDVMHAFLQHNFDATSYKYSDIR